MSVDEVVGALDRTLATRTARIELDYAQRFPDLPEPSPRRRGGLLGPSTRRASAATVRAFSKGFEKLLPDLHGEGYVDFDGHRSALNFGGYAQLSAGERMWAGPSGWRTATVPEERAGWFDPMWLLDLLRGLVDVDAGGDEPIRGKACRRYRGHADVSRASASTPGDLPVPPGAARYRDLLRVPVEVWLDGDGYIRRVRHEGEGSTLMLDIVEMGLEIQVDWSRLPALRPARRIRRRAIGAA